MSIFDLTNRVAVVTGGNGGIGLGIAQALAASGCNVSIWGRNAEKNTHAAATMAANPGKVDSQICDVTEVASVKANTSPIAKGGIQAQPGGRFAATNVTLRQLILNAYQLQDNQLAGGPSSMLNATSGGRAAPCPARRRRR